MIKVPTLLERAVDRLRNEPVNADLQKPDAGLTVGQYILAQFTAWGVRRIYGVIGDANLFFLDDIAKQEEIQYVGMLDENAAALAASAEAKLTGRIGVVLGTSGPGLTNMVNGLADASADAAGVLAITGQVDAKDIGTAAKQYIQQQLILSPTAAFAELLAHPDALPEMLQRCLVMSGARGAVTHLSIPKGMFRERVKGAVFPYGAHYHQPLLAPPGDVEETFRLMKASKRPMLLIGRGVAGAEGEALSLAESLGAAVAVTMPAGDLYPSGHELFAGGLGLAGSEATSALMAESDLVVICGATWWPDDYAPPAARVVQIDAVRENIGIRHPVERGLVGDLKEILPVLARMAKQETRDADAAAAWKRRIDELRGEWMKRIEQEVSREMTPLAPQRIMRRLAEKVPPNAVIALDTGDHTLWFHRVFANRGQRVLLSGRMRTLGFALPAAIAASLAEPDRPVVAVAGDGGVVQTLVELKTAAKLGLPIVLVVLNNGSYAIERNRMKDAGLDSAGAMLDNPDFVKIAEACGAAGIRVADDDSLRKALAEAFRAVREGKERRPRLIEVATAPLPVPHTKM